LGASLAKLIPGVGQAFGVATVSVSAAASTYAVGKVFMRHFSEGGTFLSLDSKAAKAFYAQMFAEGRRMAAGMKFGKQET